MKLLLDCGARILFSIVLCTCLHLDRTLLLQLRTLSDSMVGGFGFKNTGDNSCPTKNHPKWTGQCINNYLVHIEKYPDFLSLYLNCQGKHKENTTCFAACMLLEILERPEYNEIFLDEVITGRNVYYDASKPYPHFATKRIGDHENIFCFLPEYGSEIMKIVLSCNSAYKTKICLVDEKLLGINTECPFANFSQHCDSEMGNCDMEAQEVITVGNNAHLLQCGSFNDVKLWGNIQKTKSTHLQCLLRPDGTLSKMKRPVFKNCHLCADGEFADTPVFEFSSFPTKQDFSKVAHMFQPIVIRGNGRDVSNLQLQPQLTFSSLKQIYQELVPKNEWNKCKFQPHYSPFDNLGQAFSIVDGESLLFNWYIGWELCHLQVWKKLQNSLIRPSFLPDDFPESNNIPWIFVGQTGPGSHLHVDNAQKPVYQLQLLGNKRWTLLAPPECSHICSKPISVTVNEGDIFSIQTNMWFHQTFVENSSMSLVISTDYDLH